MRELERSYLPAADASDTYGAVDENLVTAVRGELELPKALNIFSKALNIFCLCSSWERHNMDVAASWDSRITVVPPGPYQKGFTTSSAAAPPIEQIHADLEQSSCQLEVFSIPSENNPADAPSRSALGDVSMFLPFRVNSQVPSSKRAMHPSKQERAEGLVVQCDVVDLLPKIRQPEVAED